ncbi:hypothetical protein EV363DRAFT_1162241 [Boletus edulis]|uniref:Uncharacterized protein n=1 Tax=Boletus edulis BED1 TaxID=1328754 RepID=A0AAD4BVK3_BOLED|nr:hypothetical protein EV363DRAFT_1162241 [Boletus edulis]KAF8441079.1 hypothetical protein L210DRAFT_589819 [Boletus edulis BED1]
MTLVSAWAHLEYLSIGAANNWRPQSTQSCITPDGLIQLLQTRLSLRHVALHMDTRGYTKPPPEGMASEPRLDGAAHIVDQRPQLVDRRNMLARRLRVLF